jgi:hypothetical protein
MLAAFMRLRITSLNQVSLSLGRILRLKRRMGKKTMEANISLCITRFRGPTNLSPTFMTTQLKPHMMTIKAKSSQLFFFKGAPPRESLD